MKCLRWFSCVLCIKKSCYVISFTLYLKPRLEGRLDSIRYGSTNSEHKMGLALQYNTIRPPQTVPIVRSFFVKRLISVGQASRIRIEQHYQSRCDGRKKIHCFFFWKTTEKKCHCFHKNSRISFLTFSPDLHHCSERNDQRDFFC